MDCGALSPARRPARLAALDQRSVAVHILVQGRERLLIGRGEYELDRELGGVLRVLVPDRDARHAAGRATTVELLFVEEGWTGQIRPGHALGCDYLIRLD